MNQTNRNIYRQFQSIAEELTTTLLTLESMPTKDMTEDMLLQLDIIKRKYHTLLERVQVFQEQIAGRTLVVTSQDEDQI